MPDKLPMQNWQEIPQNHGGYLSRLFVNGGLLIKECSDVQTFHPGHRCMILEPNGAHQFALCLIRITIGFHNIISHRGRVSVISSLFKFHITMIENLPKEKAKKLSKRIAEIQQGANKSMEGMGYGSHACYYGYMESALKELQRQLNTGFFYEATKRDS